VDAETVLAALVARELGEWVGQGRKRTRVPLAYAQLAEPLGVSEAAVRGLLRRARKGCRVDLAARGLIPCPRSWRAEVDARRAEMEVGRG
jgi:hypothetical protein